MIRDGERAGFKRNRTHLRVLLLGEERGGQKPRADQVSGSATGLDTEFSSERWILG